MSDSISQMERPKPPALSPLLSPTKHRSVFSMPSPPVPTSPTGSIPPPSPLRPNQFSSTPPLLTLQLSNTHFLSNNHNNASNTNDETHNEFKDKSECGSSTTNKVSLPSFNKSAQSHELLAHHHNTRNNHMTSSPKLSTHVPLSPIRTKLANSDKTKNNSPTPPDEETYHLYHEPLDPDDDIVSATQMNRNSRPSLLDDVVPPPLPPDPHSRASSNMNRFASPNSHGLINTHTGTTFSTLPTTNQSSDFQPFGTPPAGGSNFELTAAAPNHSYIAQKKDVSEDIYLCYVTFTPHRSSTLSANRSRHHASNHSTSQKHSFHSSNTLAVTSGLSADQLSPSASPATLSFNLPSAPLELRDHCIRELIETEANYVRALEMIINFFAKPLKKYMKEEEAHFIFNHIIQFHRIHKAFHADLVRACASANPPPPLISIPTDTNTAMGNNSLVLGSSLATPSSVTLGRPSSNPSTPTMLITQQFPSISSPGSSFRSVNTNNSFDLHSNSAYPLSACFLHWKDRFVMYGEYCATLSKAQSLIDELCNKNDQFNTIVQRCQHEANEGKFKLRDLLSLPMQRILKYHLLLAQLIKNTSETHEDFVNLRRAHDTMVDLGKYINEVKRDSEAMLIINDIQSSIADLEMPDNTHLTDYGRLVRDGELKTKCLDDTKIKNRYVFVFDKVMLMCKSIRNVRGEHYCYKEAIILGEFDIDDTPSSGDRYKDKWSHSFSLMRRSDRYVYTFFAKTLESKLKWIESINHAMDNIYPLACRTGRTNHSFLMHTFVKPTYCDYCSKLLHGLYYQGYRCKVCLLPAHKQCLAQTRACGTPALPPRLQPVSPSVGSTCSEDNASFFSTLGSSNTSNNPSGRFNTSLSLMGSDAHQRNTPKQPASTVEYNNIENHTASRLRQPLIPMNRASSTRVCQSPPLGTPTTKSFVQSSINVNQQNSVNHLMQQRRLLNGGSKSTPTISSVPLIRVMAISSFNGDSRYNELSMAVGDVIVVFNCNAEHPRKSHSKPTLHINGNKSTDSLKDVQKTVDHRDPSHNTWWVGKNLRTSNEGLFPADCVRTRSPERKVASCEEAQHSIDFDVAVDPAQHSYGNVDINFNKLDDGRDQQYANFVLNDYPWFSGRMDRDEAQSLLEKMTHGTFLVRISPKQNGNYVISLNYNGQVKHMRIHVSNDNQLFLSQTRYFKSIVELVTWYQENSLVESFHLLDAKLLVPYRNTD